jgi:NDP-sugar pyrophosphorylase family protein
MKAPKSLFNSAQTASTLPPVLIVAGGLGTRLGSIAEVTPKCLMPIGTEPFIAHQLRLLKKQEATEVILCLGHLGEQVRDFVGDGKKFGLKVSYVFDGERLLGTGGAIRRAIAQGAVDSSEFAMIYGDSYLDVPIVPIYQAFVESGKPALMTVLLNENRWDRSNVVMRDGRIAVYDKKTQVAGMSHIDFGLLILSTSCITKYPEDTAFDLSPVLQELVAQQQLAAFEVTQRFYEIGTPASLKEAEGYILGAV